MKFAFIQNPLTQIPFFAWIYNSFIIFHLLEWLKVRQIKIGIRVNFDQCEMYCLQTYCLQRFWKIKDEKDNAMQWIFFSNGQAQEKVWQQLLQLLWATLCQ